MQALWQYSGFEKELLKQRHCCGIAIPADDDFDLILDIELKKLLGAFWVYFKKPS